MGGKTEQLVRVAAGEVTLEGVLEVPVGAEGIVLFAHGSGSGRNSPRNRHVAGEMNKAGLATLLLDLLTEQEEAVDQLTAELRFNIDLLAQRLEGATEWVGRTAPTEGLKVGYFGASTGAAAALVAAARRPDVAAVVSRGGRPDLAGDSLQYVHASTLLIVGSHDTQVLQLNRQAMGQMQAPCELRVIRGAGHLFEEPDALEQVAMLAAGFFSYHLRREDTPWAP